MASRLGALEFSGPGGGLGEFDALAGHSELHRFHQVGDGILSGNLVAGLRGGHGSELKPLRSCGSGVSQLFSGKPQRHQLTNAGGWAVPVPCNDGHFHI